MIVRSAALSLLLAAAALAGPSVRVRVADEEHASTHAYAITDSELRSIERTPRRAEEYVTRAKSDFAEQQGYTRERFGNRNWKVLTGVRIVEVELVDRGRTVVLRAQDMPDGTDDDGDSLDAAVEDDGDDE